MKPYAYDLSYTINYTDDGEQWETDFEVKCLNLGDTLLTIGTMLKESTNATSVVLTITIHRS